MYKRIFGIGAIWVFATCCWMVLGGVTEMRKHTQQGKLRENVETLWGSSQVQAAPKLTFVWQTESLVQRTEERDGATTQVSEMVRQNHEETLLPDASRIDIDLGSDLRRKGLVWYSLYDVVFDAKYTYRHAQPEAGSLLVRFEFPDKAAIYDRFKFTIDGRDYAGTVDGADGSATARVDVAPGRDLTIELGYKSRGEGSYVYRPTPSVARLLDLEVNMRTHFAEIDYPEQTLSPGSRQRTADGWKLQWKFDQLVSGFGIGMITPQRIQPGELAAALIFSAPISLFFFFLVIFVLATLRGIDIHPINYFFVAGAFFAFHLLFAYSADHIDVEVAFVLCSCVSVALVVSYLRLVVSSRFALREAAIAQALYLVGFSLAHFWAGFTGLTITVLAIVTLFVLMQLTGRVRWSDVMNPAAHKAAAAPPAAVETGG